MNSPTYNCFKRNWRMHVCILADLPGRSVATTSTCTTKLEHFDQIRTRGKSNFENKLLETVFQLLEEIIFYYEIGALNFWKTMVLYFLTGHLEVSMMIFL